MKHWTLVVLAAAVCICSLPAAAGTIFDDFAAGNSYNCCSGWTVSSPNGPPGQFSAANEFVAGASGTVSQIDLAIGYVTGSGSGTAALYTVSGGLPGTLLGSWSFTAHQVFGNCCAIETINVAGGPSLTNGTSYFLVLSADNNGTWDAWNWNSVGATGLDLFNQGNGWINNGIQPLGTFRILSGAGVPEPGTFVMLGSGVLAAAGMIRRKLNL